MCKHDVREVTLHELGNGKVIHGKIYHHIRGICCNCQTELALTKKHGWQPRQKETIPHQVTKSQAAKILSEFGIKLEINKKEEKPYYSQAE